MLQTTENPKWVSFSADLKKLNIRFPVKDLSKKLEYPNSTVSEYVSGKKMPSKKFIDKFYEVYRDALAQANNVLEIPICAKCHEKDKQIIELEGQVKLLKELLADANSRKARSA